MATFIDTLQDRIDQLAREVMGQNISSKGLRKFRVLLGVLVIIIANVWLGGIIGHGIAALLGVALYLIVIHGQGIRSEEHAGS
ncbi:hypothetical protein QQG91_09120 [Marivivens sp. LCG002]|uniref:hypothetical protein n=1 Tax=Marivivens sp. LCG002 TaxID=3051171 RepID=UPI002556EA61|nr:hypothetical protein [Marivivens sp. LCG002]WIV49833.1 hypothetical protein QQG91_09120 [Marivivens sp. LCG002]